MLIKRGGGGVYIERGGGCDGGEERERCLSVYACEYVRTCVLRCLGVYLWGGDKESRGTTLPCMAWLPMRVGGREDHVHSPRARSGPLQLAPIASGSRARPGSDPSRA